MTPDAERLRAVLAETLPPPYIVSLHPDGHPMVETPGVPSREELETIHRAFIVAGVPGRCLECMKYGGLYHLSGTRISPDCTGEYRCAEDTA